MTDNDPTSEVSEEPQEETVQLFLDKTRELLGTPSGEKYFRVNTPEGLKVGRVWRNADKVRYLDSVPEKAASISIFSLIDKSAEPHAPKNPPYEYEDVVIITSGDQKPWVFRSRGNVGADSPHDPTLFQTIFKGDTINVHALQNAPDKFKLTQKDFEKFTRQLSEIQPTDEIPKPEFF